MGVSNGLDRRPVAVVVTTDGRRVNVPVELTPFEASPLSLVRLIIAGLEGLVGLLIAGSRREAGGTRRNGRE